MRKTQASPEDEGADLRGGVSHGVNSLGSPCHACRAHVPAASVIRPVARDSDNWHKSLFHKHLRINGQVTGW
ncbi:MAG: hypothetical protein JWM95_4880 [Gemmatimonadetes bacterium]|nr:hypothetical protein [Gemmatimonadota bacterium]